MSNFFETTLSVDEFNMYKLHAEVYQKALTKLGASPEESLMVAAHGWDIDGALASGMQAAFIERKGQSLYPLAPPPAYSVKNLVELAYSILGSQKKDNA